METPKTISTIQENIEVLGFEKTRNKKGHPKVALNFKPPTKGIYVNSTQRSVNMVTSTQLKGASTW